MKKLLLLCIALMLCIVPKTKISLAETIQVRVIYSSINVYSINDISSSEKIAEHLGISPEELNDYATAAGYDIAGSL